MRAAIFSAIPQSQQRHKAGYCIQGHVHDEVIIEAPADASLSEIYRLMEEPPEWAENLLLKVEGYRCDFYQKQ